MVYLNSCTQELPLPTKITFNFHTDCVWHSEVSVYLWGMFFACINKAMVNGEQRGCDLIKGQQKGFGLCIRSKTFRNVIAVCAACCNEVLGGWTSASGLLIT